MKLSKKEKVLRHLKEFGHINPMEALQYYSSMRLAAIIHSLKNDGHEIRTEIINTCDKFGDACHYAKYYLIGEHQLDLAI